MKILILLSLVAICLAKRNNGRSTFVFPGQPSPDGRSNNFDWDNVEGIDLLNPERFRRQENKVSSEEQVELRNPNHRDLKIGDFLASGYHGAPEKLKQDNYVKEIPAISLRVKSKSPLIKREEPLYTENTLQVLEKKDSSSEEGSGSYSESKGSSSQDQSSQSAETNNEQESSSSKENEAPVEKQEELSSSEEVNLSDEEGSSFSESAVPNNEEEVVTPAKQEQSSSSEENSPPPVNQEENSVNEESSASLSIKEEAPSSNSESKETQSNVSDKVVKKRQSGFQPFVVAKFPSFPDRGLKKRPARKQISKKGNAPGSRLVRGIDLNLADLNDFQLNTKTNNINEPQGQIKASNTQRRWKRPVKK